MAECGSEVKTEEKAKEYPLMCVRGLPFIAPFHLPGDIEKVMDFKPRDTDVFIVTYPKCGTTWSQFIVWEILNKGAVPPSPNEVMFVHIPFLELTGVDHLEDIPPPRVMKTHLPFNLQPYNSSTKYIYIVRNPFDCCVSYYYHLQQVEIMPRLTFSEHAELFLKGKIPYGDFFDHVLSWYKHKNDPNVLFLTYENMKKDKKGTFLEIAKFLGDNYYEDLQNEKIMGECLKHSDFKYMKELGMFFPDSPKKESEKLDINEMKNSMKKLGLVDKRKGNEKDFMEINFFRKGEVGDWKNHFSQQDIKLFNTHMMEKLKNSELEKFWQPLDEEMVAKVENSEMENFWQPLDAETSL